MNRRKLTKTSINERIEALERHSALLREAIDDDFEDTKKQAVDIGKLALMVGGGVVLSMILLKVFFGKKGDDDTQIERPRVYHRFRDQLASELTNRAATVFLGMAQEKLQTILQPNQAADDDSEVSPTE